MLILTNGRVMTPGGIIDPGWIGIEHGRIQTVEHGVPSAHIPGERTDLHGSLVLPGFIDIHMHGGGGTQITTTDRDAILNAIEFHQRHGTTRTLVSLVSDQIDHMVACIEAIVEVIESCPTAQTVAGIHLEGPFLNPDKRGCHHSDYVIPPSRSAMRRLLEAGQGLVRVVTLAPELPGAIDLIHDIRETGAIPSVGHTHATFEEANHAFDHGASLATHLFNAMPPIHHRKLGAAGAALAHDSVISELISDGIHLDDALVRISMNAVGADRIALVTDATPAAGMTDGEFRLGPVPIFARAGQVSLADGTLAGSTLTMDAALRHTIVKSRITLDKACTAAALTPARILGLTDTIGSIEPGKDADLVVMDSTLNVQTVYTRGVLTAPQQSAQAVNN